MKNVRVSMPFSDGSIGKMEATTDGHRSTRLWLNLKTSVLICVHLWFHFSPVRAIILSFNGSVIHLIIADADEIGSYPKIPLRELTPNANRSGAKSALPPGKRFKTDRLNRQ